jgi:phospholipase C
VTKRYAAVATLLATAACALHSSIPSGVEGLPRVVTSGVATRTPIEHVVFVIQENRSFNNLFMGYPGATTASYGYDKHGRKVGLRAYHLAIAWDLGHSAASFFAACNGTGKLPGTKCKMDGWNGENNTPNAPKNAPYSYVRRSDVEPYWNIAAQYVLADRTFASNLDGSFIAHQYLVAAYASHAVDYPFGPWGCEGGKTDTVSTLRRDRTLGNPIRACFDNPTIASEADAAGLSWRFYAGNISGDGGLWSSYQADRAVFRGRDWNADVVNPPAQFLTDVGRGKLASITWITPTWSTSDHPSIDATDGPSWVASVVNAVGTSKFWDSTAIFIMWDDWGGFFDPVKPVFEDYDGLGFRVPLLIVSPYARQGSVTHVRYETASVLRFVEDNFGLQPLAASDARANDPADDAAAFDYNQQPRKFKKIRGALSSWYWLSTQRANAKRRLPAMILGDD